MFYSKSIKLGKTTSTIKVEHSNDQTVKNQLMGLYLLCGAYNEVGRHIPTDEYLELRKRFEILISDADFILNKKHKKNKVMKEEVFKYLNELRESGETNMFGAAMYLQWEFDLTKLEARQLLAEWMQQ